jgi:formate hydrogenlyase subunit 3/multisubunit Na+/H+ antiporter MnhD subunit
MASIGTMALLFAFGGLAGPAGGYAFDSMRAHPPQAMIAALVLAAALVGCGSKGGLIPLHAWLPLAHPAAPSHVSALMSGVMTKVAIYGFVRIAFDLLGPPAWWWALPPIILGAITAVLGLLYAVLDRDLKRVLAYSTIENVGVIFVALGLALAFSANGQHEAAAVAMAAALLHVLNHSWFKSLLFLGAGAVLHATGRRDLDGLGGLVHRMPRTAAFFLVGALAASALPPLNGFVSEWLLFQAVIAAPALPQAALHFASPAIGALLALAAALAAACFVRVYGTAFLGRPRSVEAARAHDVPLAQQIAMGGLAFLCILGGLLGSLLALGLAPVLSDLVGSALPRPGSGPTVFSLVAFDAAQSVYDAPVIALFVTIAALTTLAVVHRLSARRTRRGPAWDCGFPDPSPATQYTASSFAQPLRRVYGPLAFSARETVVLPAPGDTRPARFSAVLVDHLWRTLYAAPARAVLRLSERLNVLQFLSIRRYLVLMFTALVVLLAIAAVTT